MTLLTYSTRLSLIDEGLMISRLLASTRGQIVQLLRRAAQTVNDLAAALGLTDNAVRAHLARLEEDGLVQQAGSRPGFRKPEVVYDVTREADRLFAKAYAPVLGALLGVLEGRLDGAELDAALREVGRRLAAPHLPEITKLSFQERAARAVQILEEIGGLAAVEEHDGRVYVRGFGCPLSQVVGEHPKLCVVAQAMVEELLGRPVEETCQRGGRPKCGFAVV
jgi:predicted ArsR family transcriptional regulator